MAQIPLSLRLKKRMQVDIGFLQDEIIDILYYIDGNILLHGGTAIWRCYSGNRFSEDLDFYSKNILKIENKFIEKVKDRGLQVLKFKKTGNLIFCKISNGEVEIRVEINFSVYKSPIARSYEKMDGSFIDVFTLIPEDIVLEKIDAYNRRRFIRDIYDIYHLAKYLEPNKELTQELLGFLKSLPLPMDEKNLKTLVYSGAVPSFKQIVEFLKGRFV